MTYVSPKYAIENNIMLKQILACIVSRDGPNIDFKEFAILKFKCMNDKEKLFY